MSDNGGRTLGRAAGLVLLVGILAASCAQSPAEETRPEIRVGFGGALDFGDLAGEIAHQQLEKQGYRVRVVTFASTEIAVDALSRGEVDFATGSTRSFWAAAARGAPVRAVVEHAANVFRLVIAGMRQDCAALDGQRLALHAEGAVGTVLARVYLADRCPDAHPEVLLVPVSANRLAALLSGSVAAAVLKLSDVSQVERLAPGRFTMVTDFGNAWDDLKTTLVHTNTNFAESHPDQVRDYVRARVLANRQAATDHDEVLRQAKRVLGEGSDWTPEAREYAALPAWHPDGGMTRAELDRTLRFMIDRSGIDQTLTVDRVADLSVLEDVLREVRAVTPAAAATD
ncbi:MAG: ABC transporter substrate-binding protein [Vicinamibacterales bacterium]